MNNKMNNNAVKKGLLPYVFLFAFIILCLLTFNNFNTTINKLTYDEFIEVLNEKEIHMVINLFLLHCYSFYCSLFSSFSQYFSIISQNSSFLLLNLDFFRLGIQSI